MNDIDKAMRNLSRFMMGSASEQFTDRAMTLAYEPLNVGEIDKPDGLGYIKGDCGDSMWIYIKIDGGIISKSTFITDGCGATLACGSAVTELAKNKSVSEAMTLTPKEILEYLGDLPASHHHCAVLTINTLQKALNGIP